MDGAPAATQGAEPRRAGAGLFVASLGFFVIVLDTTVVNVALPSMDDDFGASVSGLQWVVDGYLVTFAALLLSCGSLSDRFGATRWLRFGIAGFTLASVACGAAPSLGFLVAARLVQGISAAAILPASLALVRQTYDDPASRARAIAAWAAGGGIAVAAGPIVGGLLTGAIDWRAVFLVNLPIGIVGLLVLARVSPSTPRPAVLDGPGQFRAIGAVAALTFGVIEAGRAGIDGAATLAGLGLFAVCAVAFVFVERRSPAPMLPLGLFSSPTVSATTVSGFLINVAFFGQIFVLTLFFQQQLGKSPLVAGLMFFPLTALVTVSNLVAGRLTNLWGAWAPLALGELVFAAGLAGLVGVDRDTSVPLMLALMLPVGLGGGLAVPPLNAAMLEAVPNDRAGLAAGVLNASRQLGSAVGVAAFGALLSTGFIAGMHTSLLIGAAASLLCAAAAIVFVRPGES